MCKSCLGSVGVPAGTVLIIILRLSRRNIVAFKGTGRQDESDYLMQEYIVGGTGLLHKFLQAIGNQPYESTIVALASSLNSLLK